MKQCGEREKQLWWNVVTDWAIPIQAWSFQWHILGVHETSGVDTNAETVSRRNWTATCNLCCDLTVLRQKKLYRRVERWIIDKSRGIHASTELKWYIFEPIVNTNTFTRFPNTDLGSHYVIHLFKILNGIAMARYTTPESYPLPIAIHVWQSATNRAATRYEETPK